MHLVFSHHLDVGLDLPDKNVTNCVGFATSIVNRYIGEYIPRAIRVARAIKAGGNPDRLRYSVHSWIANLFVDCVPWRVADGCRAPFDPTKITCPTPEAVADFDQAVIDGDIVFSEAPFNVDAEAVGEPGFFKDLTSIAGALRERYANATVRDRDDAAPSLATWANVDVKGFARSAIPLLRQRGVGALYIGANGRPGAVPAGATPTRGLQPVVGAANATMFLWTDPPSNTSIPLLWHDGYGGYSERSSCIISPNGVALASYFRTDNAGPPDNTTEVQNVFDQVRRVFPHATSVVASSFGEFAAQALTPDVVAALPTSSLDWGDQWITGVATDPRRLAEYRVMVRARAQCIGAGRCDPGSPAMRNLTRFLAKNAEHTQGVQNEQWSPGIAGPQQKQDRDQSHWSNAEFGKVHNQHFNKFFQGDMSWLEARKFNALALEAVGEHGGLADGIRRRLAELQPQAPELDGLRRLPEPIAGAVLRTDGGGDMEIAFAADGSVSRLVLSSGGRDWASRNETLFALTYVTYNLWEKWDQKANLTCAEPGCANPEDKVWAPTLASVWHNCSAGRDDGVGGCRIVTNLRLDPRCHAKYGAPTAVAVEYVLRAGEVSVSLQWFDKRTTRLPESVMLSFFHRSDTWSLDVLGRWVTATGVAAGTTNPWQRAVWTGARVDDGSLVVESLDAALACPIVRGVGLLGDSSPMGEGNPAFPAAGAAVDGMAFNLFNNLMPISGFAQWYPFGVGELYQAADEASRFRFVVREAI